MALLQDEHIYLRPLQASDVHGNYKNWLNDSEVNKYNSHGRFGVTEDKLLKYVNAIYDNNNQLVLAIIDKVTELHIGNISLQNINWIDRNAEIAFLLGEKNYWGKGIMEKAGLLMIKHAFASLNMHRVYCATSSNNMAMQKLALKLGMQKEGERIQAIFNQGRYFNIIEFGIINSYEVL